MKSLITRIETDTGKEIENVLYVKELFENFQDISSRTIQINLMADKYNRLETIDSIKEKLTGAKKFTAYMVDVDENDKKSEEYVDDEFTFTTIRQLVRESSQKQFTIILVR